jgi:hypothetical protein
MEKSPAIRVTPVTPEWRLALLQLRVTAPQRDFVSDIAPSLDDAERCPGSTPMVILRNEEPIGYYRIEMHAASIAEREYDRPALGLRSFFIDHRGKDKDSPRRHSRRLSPISPHATRRRNCWCC